MHMSPTSGIPVSSLPNAVDGSTVSTPVGSRPVRPLVRNPNLANPSSPVILAHSRGGFVGRHVPGHSPTRVQAGPRSRSLSLGSPPLGWSPHRAGPLSPKLTAISNRGVLPGFPEIQTEIRSLPLELPIISESQRAMEAAVQKERERTKAMEKEEANLTAEELRSVLKRERHRMARVAADLAAMRSMAVQSVAQAEVCEEGRINTLMRRLDSVQAEKGRIIVELEREEEMVCAALLFCL